MEHFKGAAKLEITRSVIFVSLQLSDTTMGPLASQPLLFGLTAPLSPPPPYTPTHQSTHYSQE